MSTSGKLPGHNVTPEAPFVSSGYGLTLHANFSIPGLFAEPERPAHVRIWFGETPPDVERLLAQQRSWYVSNELDERGIPGLSIWTLANGDYFRFAYADGCEFIVDAPGARVWATWSSNGSPSDAASYLLGPILGFVLRLRGVTSLHASAIAIDGRAIAFIGPSGAGKSTTAGAFGARGFPIIADDIVALSYRANQFIAHPGTPRLRLWPSSVEAIAALGGPQRVCLPPDWGTKRYYLDLTRGGYKFERRPLPLAAIYLLAERSESRSAPGVETMNGNGGLMALVANTYATKLLDSAQRAQEFALLSKLFGLVPVRRLCANASSFDLAQLVDTIVRDLKQLDVASMRVARVV